MRLIDNKVSKVDNEMEGKVFKNQFFWSSNINVYLNQNILLSALLTSFYLMRDIYDEIN